MLGWFTTPCGASRASTTAEVRGAAEGWVWGRGEAACSTVSGKSLARACTVVSGTDGVKLEPLQVASSSLGGSSWPVPGGQGPTSRHFRDISDRIGGVERLLVLWFLRPTTRATRSRSRHRVRVAVHPWLRRRIAWRVIMAVVKAGSHRPARHPPRGPCRPRGRSRPPRWRRHRQLADDLVHHLPLGLGSLQAARPAPETAGRCMARESSLDSGLPTNGPGPGGPIGAATSRREDRRGVHRRSPPDEDVARPRLGGCG
jgi:hypothetical protein